MVAYSYRMEKLLCLLKKRKRIIESRVFSGLTEHQEQQTVYYHGHKEDETNSISPSNLSAYIKKSVSGDKIKDIPLVYLDIEGW